MNQEEITTISELVEDQGIFDCRGYSTVKVTRIEENSTTGQAVAVEKPLRVPIKSTGVAEYQERLKDKAPRPPVVKTMIKKDSPEGKELGLPHDRIVQTFDLTDQNYIDELDKFNQELSWKVAIFALDIAWKKKNGEIAETFEEKKQVLKSNSITLFHINKILKDVNELAAFAEDREDFLSGKN